MRLCQHYVKFQAPSSAVDKRWNNVYRNCRDGVIRSFRLNRGTPANNK